MLQDLRWSSPLASTADIAWFFDCVGQSNGGDRGMSEESGNPTNGPVDGSEPPSMLHVLFMFYKTIW